MHDSRNNGKIIGYPYTNHLHPVINLVDTETKLISGLSRFLTGVLPDREGLLVSDTANITDGWETEIYSFALDYQKDSTAVREHLILRMYPGRDAREKSKREFQVMKALFKAGYPVPEVYFVEEDVSYVGKPFMIMQRIPGQPLWDLISRSSRERQLELLSRFCKLYVELHALDWKGIVPGIGLPERKLALKEALSYYQAHIEHFRQTEFVPVLEWLKKRLKDISGETFSIIHSDFHPNNVLIADDGSLTVIDWGNWRVMDYRIDLGWTMLLVGSYESMELRDAILHRYEELTGSEIANVEYFDVVAALRRLVDISSSLSAGATELGMRKEAVEMMKSSVRHVKNVHDLLVERTGITVKQVEELIQQLSDQL